MIDKPLAATQVILDTIPSWVILKDRSNRILQVNQSVLTSIGLPRSEVEGRDSKEVFPQDADRFYADDLAVIESGTPKLGIIEPAGDRWLRTDKVPLKDDAGVVYGVLVVSTDITPVKQAEETAKSLRLMQEQTERIAGVGGWEVNLANSSDPLWTPEVCRIHEVPESHRPTLEEAIAYYEPASRTLVEEAVQRCINEHEPWDLELTLITAKGNKRRVRAVGEPELDRGKCVRLWGTLQDISDRYEVGQRLKLTQRTVDRSGDAVFFIRPDGSLSYTNELASQLLQYTAEELGELSIADIHPDDPLGGWPSRWMQTKEAGEVFLESQHRRKDGSHYDCEVRYSYFEYEGDALIVATVRDITERKRTEATLAKLGDIVDKSRNEIYIFRQVDLRYVYLNSGALLNLGYSLKEARKMTPLQITPEYDAEAYAELLAPLSAGHREHLDLETVHQRRDGTRYNIEVQLQCTEYEGEPCFVAIVVDTTVLQQSILRLEQANAELEQFTYVASHDLKAPLRAVDHLAGWIEEDLAGAVPEKTATHIRLLQQRVRRMESLLDDLLEYSRAGRLRDDVSEIDLENLVEGVILLSRSEKKYEVKVEIDAEGLRGRRTPLETVIRNLVGNAIKHHDRPSGQIIVAARDCPADDHYVEFSVADDGPGIPANMHEKAFGMFQTLRPRDEVEGSGMGLALVKKTVESEGGRAWIEAVEPRGTRVCFTWPRMSTAPPPRVG